jgi:hypothetical protein
MNPSTETGKTEISPMLQSTEVGDKNPLWHSARSRDIRILARIQQISSLFATIEVTHILQANKNKINEV